jgi:biotin synthase
MNIHALIDKSRDGHCLSREELVCALSLPPHSPESLALMAEAARVSREVSDGKAEVHAQLALNLAPCPGNCMFCSFAAKNRVFDKEVRVALEEALPMARQFEEDGANAVFIMSTAQYPFGLFLEYSREIRKALRPETVLIANTGDRDLDGAKALREAGYAGVYHALRLREGTDTALDPERRRKSIREFQEAGLVVGTCVEPVGPEHTAEELAEMILYTASFSPAYSGAARRISIPGTPMEKRGMISELRMAQVVAATRLGVPRTVKGNCTHEPCALGALAGANLFWAEVGANPRDTKERTEEGRGGTVAHCRKLFSETEIDVLNGPSVFYRA